MVKNEMLVQGVDLTGIEQKPPVILQMNDDDFPARFLKDLASPELSPISSAAIVDTSSQPLYQPVQRMLNVAMVDLSCTGLGNPRIDPRRILSAGLVIRRVVRKAQGNGTTYEDYNTLSAWMRNPAGQFQWVKLPYDQECWDPDPTKQPQLKSGQPDLDQQLAALYLSTANTESTSPAFAAPPATCAALGRTVFYAVIPTASSEVSNTQPAMPPNIQASDLIPSLPPLLRSSQYTAQPSTPSPAPVVDYHWMSDEFLNAVYPPTPSTQNPPTAPTPNSDAALFHGFTTALRMLHTVFNAFDGSAQGSSILNLLNQHNVTFPDGSTQPMGDFYQSAKVALLDYNPYPTASPNPPTLQMPASWDSLNDSDQSALAAAMIAAIGPRSQSLNLLSPQGRFMDDSRHYKLRMFFRVKGDSPTCPPRLFWSQYSEPFMIAPWHATGNRAHPPIPLPDPTSSFMQGAKPNCSFQVPGSLMSAMQGSSLSGLMSGSGGGPQLKLGWICGFNIPLITICAFFVLNIFLSLLNIIFFWLPFIKICIPFPMPSTSTPDEGAP
jgi:hypothetical protein